MDLAGNLHLVAGCILDCANQIGLEPVPVDEIGGHGHRRGRSCHHSEPDPAFTHDTPFAKCSIDRPD